MGYASFGRLVAALRKQRFDENWMPWTQQKLGQLTGLGSHIVAKIEQGQRQPDPDVLARLAGAFQLTEMERQEFYSSSYGQDEATPLVDDGAAEETLKSLLDALACITLPASIQDDYGDLIAANAVILHFTGISRSELDGNQRFFQARYSTMRLIFDPDLGYQQLLGAQWRNVARRQLQLFRRITLRRQASSHLIAVQHELMQMPAFRSAWAEASIALADWDSNLIECEHVYPPGNSRVRYVCVATPQWTPWGQLFLATFVPLDHRTQQVFTWLGKEAPANAHRFATWPKPPHPPRNRRWNSKAPLQWNSRGFAEERRFFNGRRPAPEPHLPHCRTRGTNSRKPGASSIAGPMNWLPRLLTTSSQ